MDTHHIENGLEVTEAKIFMSCAPDHLHDPFCPDAQLGEKRHIPRLWHRMISMKWRQGTTHLQKL